MVKNLKLVTVSTVVNYNNHNICRSQVVGSNFPTLLYAHI